MTDKMIVMREPIINDDGVTLMWSWICPNCDIWGNALFWENAIRGAHHHIKWHLNRSTNASL